MEPNDVDIRQQREKFIKAFDDLAEATASLVLISKKQIELVNKQIEVTNGLIETMMMPKDGMRAVIDEVLDELRGFRDDIRTVAKAGGFNAALSALFGSGRRKA